MNFLTFSKCINGLFFKNILPRYDWAEVDSLVKDHWDDINKLAERGLVVLSYLIDNTHLIEIGWMVFEGCNGIGPSKPVQT